MADGCGCNPLEDGSCVSNNCVRDNPMLRDVGICFPAEVIPVAVPLAVDQQQTLENACMTDDQCVSDSCTLVSFFVL